MSNNKKPIILNFIPQKGDDNPNLKVPLSKIVERINDKMWDVDAPVVNAGGALEWAPKIDDRVPTPNDVYPVKDNTEMEVYLERHYAWNFLDGRSKVLDIQLNMKVKPVTVGQLRTGLLQMTGEVDAIMTTPHYPARDRVFYIRGEDAYKKGNGKALSGFLDMMNPDTDEDQDLLEAMIMTMAWGGPPGSRPFFTITSDHGKGVGKTTTAEKCASIFGGCIRINPTKQHFGGLDKELKENIGKQDNAMKLMVLIDNVKGELQSSMLESWITSDSLSARRLHFGPVEVANYKIFVITNNIPELSTDLATRTVPIKIGPKKDQGSSDWLRKVDQYIDDNREDLLRDILSRLRMSSQSSIKTKNGDRFAAWTKGVLSRFSNGQDLFDLIEERRQETDKETGEADALADIIKSHLRGNGIDPDNDTVCIPTDQLQGCVQDYLGWNHSPSNKRTKDIIKPLLNAQPFRDHKAHNGREKSGKRKRGLLWNVPFSETTGPEWSSVVSSQSMLQQLDKNDKDEDDKEDDRDLSFLENNDDHGHGDDCDDCDDGDHEGGLDVSFLDEVIEGE